MHVQPENFRSWIEYTSSPISFNLEEYVKSGSQMSGLPPYKYETSRTVKKYEKKLKKNTSAYKTPLSSVKTYDGKSINGSNSWKHTELKESCANNDSMSRDNNSPYEDNVNNILMEYLLDTGASTKHQKKRKKKNGRSSKKSQSERMIKSDSKKGKKISQKLFEPNENKSIENSCQKTSSIRKSAFDKFNANFIERNEFLKQKYQVSSTKFYDLIQYFLYPLDTKQRSSLNTKIQGSERINDISSGQKNGGHEKSKEKANQAETTSVKFFTNRTLDYTSDKIYRKVHSIKRSFTADVLNKKETVLSSRSTDISTNSNIQELVNCLPSEFNRRVSNENASSAVILKASCDYIRFLENKLALTDKHKDVNFNFNIDKYFSLEYPRADTDMISDGTISSKETSMYIKVIPSAHTDTLNSDYAIQEKETGLNFKNTSTD